MLFGWLAVLAAAIRPAKSKTHGSDITVDVPLRLCRSCLPRFESMKSQSKLREILRRVPACCDLLDTYPGATVYPN
jgi:hypothetical protein